MSTALAMRPFVAAVLANARDLVIINEFEGLTYDTVANFQQASIFTIGDLLDYWTAEADPQEALVLTDDDMVGVQAMIDEINEHYNLSLALPVRD